MNRRAFFVAPLALLPGAAPATGDVTINLSGAVLIDQKFVDEQLVPALRGAFARDVVIISPGSRQALDLR